MRINFGSVFKKSRLAGFFLLLLTGCQPDPQPYRPGQLSFEQAEIALRQQLPVKAAQLYRQAAEQGFLPAVDAYIRTQQHVEGQPQTLVLLQWLQQLPLYQPHLAGEELDAAMQLQFSTLVAELGGWQLLPIAQQRQLQQPFQLSQQSRSGCALTLQPVLTTLQSARQWALLSQQWQQDQQLSTLALCFNPPQFVDSRQLACTEQSGVRIRCQAQALLPIVLQGHATQLIVISGSGHASYNNGWLQLPVHADLALLRHEISHLFGFLDEYPLTAAVASDECVVGRITPNLLFSKQDLTAYLQHWQLLAPQVVLTAVNTCQHVKQPAYRVVAADSHLQHYELAMPALYLQLMQQQLQQPQLLMPVQYYFAYLARQQQNWPQWQQLMQLAAKKGYPAAIEALTDFHQPEIAPKMTADSQPSTD